MMIFTGTLSDDFLRPVVFKTLVSLAESYQNTQGEMTVIRARQRN